MKLASLGTRPAFVRWGILVDRAPSWCWLALLAAALWPTWWWMARRMADRSDDPLGLLALAALALAVAGVRRRLRVSPQLDWLATGLLLALLALVFQGTVAPLLAALAAVLGLACAIAAFLPAGVARGPVLGLAVLALPLLASLQFYAGYPLRLVTAEASRWLLSISFDVQRTGTALLVDGRLVIVDAPCSGVQMVWFGYFTACAVAWLWQRSDRVFLLRLPLVGALVLTGNVLRNTLLVAAEGAGRPLAPWAHEALGLVVLAAVCAGIGWAMARPQKAAA